MLNKRIIIITLAMLYSILVYHCHKDNPLDNVPEVPQELELINDDFEGFIPGIDYINTQVAEGKWYVWTTGPGGAQNHIVFDNTVAHSGIQSMRIEKEANSMDAVRTAEIEPIIQSHTLTPVYISLFCYSSNLTSQPLIAVGRGDATMPSLATNMLILLCNDLNNGNQFSVYTNSVISTHLVGSVPGLIYTPGSWYKIDIVVDTLNRAFSVIVNDAFQFNGSYSRPQSGMSANCIQLGIGTNPTPGQAWFDRLRVWSTPAH